jgi:hypothetical protein
VQALGGIVDTVAIGCIMYYGTMSYITPESRTPASDNIVAYTIAPIGCMNIFFSFTIGEGDALFSGRLLGLMRAISF